MSRTYGHPVTSAPFQAAHAGVLSFVGYALGRALEIPLDWLQHDRDRRALQALDDRLLSDIGVSRGEVQQEVLKPFWRA